MNAVDRLLALVPWRRSRLRVVSISERPSHLDALLVPRTIVTATLEHLRDGGVRDCEEFAFWCGHVIAGRIGIVSRTFHPRTIQSRGHVMIDDDAQLLAMTDLVHEHDEVVLCQLHTHPDGAFHSLADDRGAFTDEIGFLSLVLPNFAAGGLETAEVFQCTKLGWEHLSSAISGGLIHVFDDVLHYDLESWRAG